MYNYPCGNVKRTNQPINSSKALGFLSHSPIHNCLWKPPGLFTLTLQHCRQPLCQCHRKLSVLKTKISQDSLTASVCSELILGCLSMQKCAAPSKHESCNARAGQYTALNYSYPVQKSAGTSCHQFHTKHCHLQLGIWKHLFQHWKWDNIVFPSSASSCKLQSTTAQGLTSTWILVTA